MQPLDLNDPTTVLLAVARSLQDAGIRAATYGGLALAAYGEPRETTDADLAVAGVGGTEGLEALRRSGLEVSLSFDRMRFGGNLVTRIAILGGVGGSLNVADLVEPRSARYATAALGRAITGSLRGESIAVLSPEDFVLFKVLSTRDRDLEDAATVLRSPGVHLDVSFVKSEGAALALEISDHDVAGRLRRLLDGTVA